MSDTPKCELCGEPMPISEEMFKYHGYSGPCPKPPLPKKQTAIERLERELAQAKEQLAVREATISFLDSRLNELGFHKNILDGELENLREHEAKVLEEAAERLNRIMGGDGLWQHEVEDELRRMAQERRNYGT